MALRIGDEAPNFTAHTTEGDINFHEWLGEGWGVLFSHPKDFTPVCTTELGYMASLKPDFEKRGVKIMADGRASLARLGDDKTAVRREFHDYVDRRDKKNRVNDR